MKKISPLAPGGFPDMPAVPACATPAGRTWFSRRSRPGGVRADEFVARFLVPAGGAETRPAGHGGTTR